jgi:hypothetical protein
MDRRSNTSTSTWVRKRSHPCMDDGLLHATAIGVGSLHASVHHEMVGRAWSEATPDPDLTTSNKQTSAWPNRSFSVLVASVRAGSWVLLVGSGTGCSSPLAHVPHVIHLVARASDKCCCLQLCSLCQSSLGVADHSAVCRNRRAPRLSRSSEQARSELFHAGADDLVVPSQLCLARPVLP